VSLYFIDFPTLARRLQEEAGVDLSPIYHFINSLLMRLPREPRAPQGRLRPAPVVLGGKPNPAQQHGGPDTGENLNVIGLPAFLPLDHLELNCLPILQAAEAVRLDGGEVHEDIFAALAGVEPVALRVVKPVDCTCSIVLFVPCVEFAVNFIEVLKAGNASGRISALAERA